MRRILAVLFGVLVVALVLWTTCAPRVEDGAPRADETPLRQTEPRRRAQRPVDQSGEAAERPAAAEAPPGDAQEIEIVVTVLDAAGVRVANAQVDIASGSGEPLASVVTDEHGRARARSGERDVLARVTGPGGQTSPWKSIWPGLRELELTATDGVLLTGQVVAARSGGPISGAELVFRDTSHRAVAAQMPPLAERRSDASGMFEAVSVARGRVAVVTVRAGGYAGTEVEIEIPAAGEVKPLHIELEPAGAVVGRVLSPDGDPVAGARVVAVRGDRAYMQDAVLLAPGDDARVEARGFLTTRTDEQGAFRIRRVPVGGVYVALAGSADWAPSVRSEPLELTSERPEAMVDLTLQRFARLDIVVLDPEGRAVQDADTQRSARYRWGPTEVLLPSGEPGTYRLENEAPGFVTITVEVDGFPAVAHSVVLAPGEQRVETVHLAAAQTIRGVVVDDRDTPIVSARVTALATETQLPRAPLPEVQSDRAGVFVIEGLAPGPHRLVARADGHESPRDAESQSATAPAEGVTIRLVRTAQVVFRVRVPAGATTPRTISFNGSAGGGALNWRADGYTLRNISRGERWIGLHVDGYASVRRALLAEPGGRVDLGEILLDPGVTLRGRVLGGDGAPLEDAEVRLIRTDSLGDPTTRSDAAGVFELPHASRGENEIVVRADGHLPLRGTVPGEGDDSARDVRLQRGGLLRIRVTDARNRPAFGVFLHVLRIEEDGATSRAASPSTDNTGRCEIRVPAGRYRVVLSAEIEPREIQLREGRTLELALQQPQ